MITILVTGYEAFGHTPINPAEQVARALDGKQVENSTIIGRVIPNVFFKAIDVVRAAMDELPACRKRLLIWSLLPCRFLLKG